MKYVSKAEVCDFCNDSDPAFVYPADDFSVYAVEADGSVISSFDYLGGWAACRTCQALIVSNNRDGLARRAVNRIREIRDYPGETEVQMRTQVRMFHDMFFSVRRGPAQPLHM